MKLTYWLSLYLLFSVQAIASSLESKPEKLVVGLIEGGRAPYFFAKESKKQGLYRDILSAIERKTNINFIYRYYPQARLRRMMVSGRLDIEMGTDPLWRQEKNEINITSYSEPFMLSRESWVVSSDNKHKLQYWIDFPQEAVPCVVLGFNIEESMKKAGSDVQGNSDQHLLEMLKRKRCDIALIPNAILDYYQSFSYGDFTTLAAKKEYQLRIRIGKKRQYLLPQINCAITEMKLSGELSRLLKKYDIRNNG